ncbi:MAG: tetratricopeptide repeat protein, partial [Pyrinomonadaceae bacterium]
HLLYGTLLRLNGDYQEAEKVLLKAKSLAKKPNPEISWQLALLYNKLKRNKEAANELETYLKIYPDSPDKKKVEDLIAKLKASKDG